MSEPTSKTYQEPRRYGLKLSLRDFGQKFVAVGEQLLRRRQLNRPERLQRRSSLQQRAEGFRLSRLRCEYVRHG